MYMTKKFVAITVEGSEFLYSRGFMIAVPTSTAQLICDALNKVRYELKPNQKWWVYDNDDVSDDWIEYEIRRFSKKAGKLRIQYYDRYR